MPSARANAHFELGGVAPDAIRVDRHGHRTLDSMIRVREEFGFRDALVVTNGFYSGVVHGVRYRCEGGASRRIS